MNETRWNNYGMWACIAILIGAILKDALGFAGLPFVPERYDQYVQYILYILVIAGVISNPKEGQWFSDIKKISPFK